MSRRDTIVFAVLINTALLIVLFSTATRTEAAPQPSLVEQQIHKDSRAPEPIVAEMRAIGESEDQVDHLLTQLSSRSFAQNNVVQRVVTPNPTPTPATRSAPPTPKTPSSRRVARSSTQAATSQPVAAARKSVEITVKRGDVLEKIARTNGVTVSDIIRANNLPDTRLRIGQVLTIPVREKVAAKAGSQDSSGEHKYYVVRSGDNPWLIALRNQLSLDDLLQMNQLDEDSARRLRPGDQLRIR
jgi:peptidoglycan endopeptidase LytF